MNPLVGMFILEPEEERSVVDAVASEMNFDVLWHGMV
jgi:hypothetical protein